MYSETLYLASLGNIEKFWEHWKSIKITARHDYRSCLIENYLLAYWMKFTWTSIGKELNLIGQMKVILLARACIRLWSSSTHRPSSLDKIVWVSNDWRLRISTSGIQRSLSIARFRAVRTGTSKSLLFLLAVWDLSCWPADTERFLASLTIIRGSLHFTMK